MARPEKMALKAAKGLQEERNEGGGIFPSPLPRKIVARASQEGSIFGRCVGGSLPHPSG
jgi:hypothetical protein